MPKRKSRLVAFTFCEPDTLHSECFPFVNFCCEEKQLQTTLQSLDKTGLFKNNDKLLDTFKIGAETVLENNLTFIDEITVDSKLKKTDTYIYRFHDYSNHKTNYYSFDDTIKELNKKIKNKYAQIAYDGVFEKIEYSEKEAVNVLSRMSAETHEISIAQIKSNGDYDNIILITPLKLLYS